MEMMRPRTEEMVVRSARLMMKSRTTTFKSSLDTNYSLLRHCDLLAQSGQCSDPFLVLRAHLHRRRRAKLPSLALLHGLLVARSRRLDLRVAGVDVRVVLLLKFLRRAREGKKIVSTRDESAGEWHKKDAETGGEESDARERRTHGVFLEGFRENGVEVSDLLGDQLGVLVGDVGEGSEEIG